MLLRYTKEDVYVTINKKELKNFNVFLEYTGPLQAPIKAGQEIATIKIFIKDEDVINKCNRLFF